MRAPPVPVRVAAGEAELEARHRRPEKGVNERLRVDPVGAGDRKPAVHEHKGMNALGVRDGDTGHDVSAKRVSDKHRAIQTEGVKDGQYVAHVDVDPVRSGKVVATTPAADVERHQRDPVSQRPRDHRPRVTAARDPVHRHHHRHLDQRAEAKIDSRPPTPTSLRLISTSSSIAAPSLTARAQTPQGDRRRRYESHPLPRRARSDHSVLEIAATRQRGAVGRKSLEIGEHQVAVHHLRDTCSGFTRYSGLGGAAAPAV